MVKRQTPFHKPVSRRTVLKQSATVTAALGAASFSPQLTLRLVPQAWAADHPAIGTYPSGSSGDTVYVGAAVPRTGTYAVQGEDELKGFELAVEHSTCDGRRQAPDRPEARGQVLALQQLHDDVRRA